MNGTVRHAPSTSVLGSLTVLLVLLGAAPAAAQEKTPANPPESAPSPPSDEVVQAFVVGGIAFAAMIGAACAVLFYTARNRRHVDGG